MRKKTNKLIFAGCLASLLLFATCAWGASSILSKHETDSGTGYFDLTVSLDWTPTQEQKDGMLKTAFSQFGKDVFTMSEGKQKLRTVYVYVNKAQMGSADIRFLDKGGRSNATVNGIFQAGGRILTYTGFSSGAARTAEYMGHTMAHEFGHYGLGIYDEYVGGQARSLWPSTPLSSDTPKNTIMNHQGSWQWLSTAGDYDAGKKTAQWRTHKASAWDTLVRSPKNDPRPQVLKAVPGRSLWGEFNGCTAPKKAADLTKPVTGWDTKFEIKYMQGETAVVLSIDDSGSMGGSGVTAAKQAAQEFVDNLQVGDRIGIIKFTSAWSQIYAITEIADETTKTNIKNAIVSNLYASGGTSFSAALQGPLSLFNGAGMGSDITRYVIMMSDGGASYPTSEIATYNSENIPVYTIGLGSGVDSSMLQSIADATGGKYYNSPDAAQLAAVYLQVSQETSAGDQAVVSSEQEGLTMQGETFTLNSVLSPQDGQTVFRASWTAGNTMSFALTTPGGTLVTAADAAAMGYTYSEGATSASYIVPAPESGTWAAAATAETAPAGTADVKIEVTSESTMVLTLSLEGGTWPEPIRILAALNAPEPVVNATVVATVTGPNNFNAIIPMRDDGISPDNVGNDGVYSGALATYTTDGEYDITVNVENADGKAALDNSGATEQGDDAPAQPLDDFQRVEGTTITTDNFAARGDADTYTAAVLLPIDNTAVWGVITHDEDCDWFYFDAMQGDLLYLMTSELWSTTDGLAMATNMVLYGPDGTTALAASAHYDGTDTSLIEWTCPADGRYYIKVSHASPGTGIFSLTAGPENIFLPAAEAGEADAAADQDFTTDKSSGPFGCFIDTLLK